MNKLTTKEEVRKGSKVEVSLAAKSIAHKAIGSILAHTGENVTLKDFYSRQLEISSSYPTVIKATVESFIKQKQVA